jgi:hypothetical protein
LRLPTVLNVLFKYASARWASRASFSPIYRAGQDLSELTRYSDFLKMVMYHNCGGERMASYTVA